MDFSWVKELADTANDKEVKRQEEERRQKLERRQLSLSTPPLVEKLHVLLNTCSEEFNKFCHYPHLRVVSGRVQKRTISTENPDDPELTYKEEATSFAISRQDWTYGVRGSKGTIEFLELPSSSQSGGLKFRLDEAGATPSHKLEAHLDEESGRIVWKMDGRIMDGPAIVALCRDYFKEFIEKTNPKSE